MSPLRVLIVDDDFMVARVHTGFVASAPGCEVVGVATVGTEAVAAIADLDPDVVLLDVHLPDLDGLAVLRRVRAQGFAGDVLMVTAERDPEAVRTARAAGAGGYLVKPFTREDLHHRLAQIRTTRERLLSLPDRTVDQRDIDRVFGAGAGERAAPLPKGLNPTTADLVLAALTGREMSAAECADELGLARVTARRYLEHFVGTGRAQARQQYGRPGRPERRYSRTDGAGSS